MRIHNLYTDANGDSHFRDIDVEMSESAPGNLISKTVSSKGMFFRESTRPYDTKWHAAPRRQYIVYLDHSVKITASDGEVRVIGPGEVVLVEDTSGKGHLIEGLGDPAKPRKSVFIPLE